MATSRTGKGAKEGIGVEINGNCSKESKKQKRISNCEGICSGGSSLNAAHFKSKLLRELLNFTAPRVQ